MVKCKRPQRHTKSMQSFMQALQNFFLSMSLCSLYLNPLSKVAKQSLYARGVPRSHSGQRVKVLASVTEGTDLSENWRPILNVIRENASSWDQQRVIQQLKVYTYSTM